MKKNTNLAAKDTWPIRRCKNQKWKEWNYQTLFISTSASCLFICALNSSASLHPDNFSTLWYSISLSSNSVILAIIPVEHKRTINISCNLSQNPQLVTSLWAYVCVKFVPMRHLLAISTVYKPPSFWYTPGYIVAWPHLVLERHHTFAISLTFTYKAQKLGP